ncbi:MAG: hypothetical protein WC802_01455 [Patescibacteria group bacterium]|jgi:hypothetical protein
MPKKRELDEENKREVPASDEVLGLDSEHVEVIRWASDRAEWLKQMEYIFTTIDLTKEEQAEYLVKLEEEKKKIAGDDLREYQKLKNKEAMQAEKRQEQANELQKIRAALKAFDDKMPKLKYVAPEIAESHRKAVKATRKSIDETTEDIGTLENELKGKEDELKAMNFFTKLLKGGAVNTEIQALQEKLGKKQARLERLQKDLEAFSANDNAQEAVEALKKDPEYLALQAKLNDLERPAPASGPDSIAIIRMLKRHALFFGDAELEPYIKAEEETEEELAEHRRIAESVGDYAPEPASSTPAHERYIPDEVVLRVLKKHLQA